MNIRNSIAACLVAVLTSWAATSGAGPASAQTAPAAPPTSQQRIVKPPKLVRFVEAPYPETERAAQRTASVLLAISIAADGTVADVSVVESAGAAFDAAAETAARQFEFEPAEVDGSAVPVRIQYRYDFSLAGKTAAPPVKTTSDFAGIVRDRKTGRPFAGVRVDLDGLSTTTDAQGRFHFSDVEPGVHAVTLSGSEFTPTATEENLATGERYDAAYDVEARSPDQSPDEQVDLELVIVDTPMQKSIAATSISSEQGGRVAGTGGDVIKVVENLPGVARSSVGSGALVVWGAAGADTRVYVDDVHIPVLYHEGGFRSVIHSDLVKSVELEPGGYGAAHGRGLGGLVTVGLKPLQADGYHGSLALDAIDAAGSLRGNVGSTFRYAAALRRSHLDWVLAQVTSRDVGEFVPIPRYLDSQVRLVWAPTDGESLELGGLLSSDTISRSIVAADPAENKRDSKRSGFDRVYLRYEHRTEDGARVTVTPFVGLDRSSVENRFGAVPAQIDNRATLYGVRAAYSGNATEYLTLSTGIDAELMTSTVQRIGSVTSPAREGDIHVFGQTPSDQINADRWTSAIASLAPYAQADLALLDNQVHLIPGVRVESTLVQASRRTPVQGDLPTLGTMNEQSFLEPRLAARWALSDAFGLRAAVGIYHQPPLAEDLSAVFGNPQLGASKALHYLGGANVKFSDALTLEVTGFFSRQSDLVTRSALATPRQAEALVQDGFGRAYGAQFLLRHDLTGRFFGWLSYSIVRSQRIDAGVGEYRLFDYDQTHVLTALGSYNLGAGFEVGARFRFSSGYPRTPVIGAVYDSRIDAYQPVFGAHNSIRIPAFYTFDVRVTKRFSLGGGSELELYLDVQNVTDHRNPEEIVYNFDYSKRSYITGLSILPVLGVKLTW
jgi:TonB family protein